MSNQLTPEIAMAIQKGERDYAELLHGLGFARAHKTVVLKGRNLIQNKKHGHQYLERCLRDCA